MDPSHDSILAEYLERQRQAAENKARAHAQWRTPAVPNLMGKRLLVVGMSLLC